MIDATPGSAISRHDITAMLKNKGVDLRAVARENSVDLSSLYRAKSGLPPRPARIIASLLGREVWDLWPTIYDRYGNRIRTADAKAGDTSSSSVS